MNRIENIKQVILYFLKRAEEDYFPIGMVRITKLLYLFDLEYYRDYGKTFTGFNWIFYKYGPYTTEIEDVLSHIGVDLAEEVITSEKSIKRLKVSEPEEIYINSQLENYLHRIWTEWGLESLPKLLDFVYFETEPMIHAKIGKSIKEKLSRIVLPPAPVFPMETADILKIWDEDKMADLRGLKGKASIDFIL